ncbi:peptide deformylase [Roseomonas sp. KE2513]|uniref:peptide deformylase n=1 Tax=Roseomonas sp. KE2513 TaxID=2479202 RepID=UPI0018DFCB42|nr:peptide deformylase [Roseomonas sp. KE2513]MBI0534009.1 peptide deformylase [Roseomonas sp. KE2513]
MAILKIARLGHPVLLQRAEPVPDPTAPAMRRLVTDMAETMLDANGLGLAAPQVHVPLRVFVMRDGKRVFALFNPEITPLTEAREPAWEGCLSIPGLRGEVTRPTRIAWRGLDAEGAAVSGEADGLAARVMQHEFDHLEGMLYPMRMEDLSRLGFVEELSRFLAKPTVADVKEEAP